jgi:hypothetical protein
MGLFDLFSNDTAEQAAQQRNAGLQQGYDALSSNYGQGRNALTSNYDHAAQLYKNLLTSNTAGANAYGDASGANGAAGLQRATQNFQSSPQYGAYGFSLDQGLQGLNRTHAAAGNLSSGNADADSMKFASGLAGQQYNSYLQGLQPYLGGQQAATAGAANAATGLGGNLNQSFQGQGNAANANFTGQGASNAAATMNNYNVGKNQLGAILGIGQLAFGMPPTSFGSIGGNADGGTASNPTPGLSPSDYGIGSNAGSYANQFGSNNLFGMFS